MGLKKRKDKERTSKPITDLNKNSKSDKQARDIDDLVKQFGEMKIMLSEIAKNSSKSNLGHTSFCRACVIYPHIFRNFEGLQCNVPKRVLGTLYYQGMRLCIPKEV